MNYIALKFDCHDDQSFDEWWWLVGNEEKRDRKKLFAAAALCNRSPN